MIFFDMLYGKIHLPDWLDSFIRMPEFVRLRGVRLSNVDSIDFTDFGRASRWEHSIGVAYLACKCSDVMRLTTKNKVELVLASLLHDIATPPFAHTVERIISGFDHERETQKLVGDGSTDHLNPGAPVYLTALPRFHDECSKLSKKIKTRIEPDNVAKYIAGDGELGFLVSGTLDLDNADNVIRGSTLMGIDVDKRLPVRLSEWLAVQPSMPIDLDRIDNYHVKAWIKCRKQYYLNFFEASMAEKGRQAYLQYLLRRALRHGLSFRAMIWNTDDGLLDSISNLEKTRIDHAASLQELVNRYRLMETVHLIGEFDIRSMDLLRVVSTPNAVDWIEQQINSSTQQIFIFISEKKVKKDERPSLMGEVVGKVSLFKLGTELDWEHLGDSIKNKIAHRISGKSLQKRTMEVLWENINGWATKKPWHKANTIRIKNVSSALEQVGDWSFRFARNETLHSYPSTFVHAIPATLIEALGLRGSRILDPFGGTGQTALETIRMGGEAISADINYVALLVSKVKFSYIERDDREMLFNISASQIHSIVPSDTPSFPLIEKWHHQETLVELRKLLSFIKLYDNSSIIGTFLQLCFSAILTSTTARRGKQHGWFADNTPLSRSEVAPPYQPAINFFIQKIKQNISILEKMYGFFERRDLDPKIELGRAAIKRIDASSGTPNDYGVDPGSVNAIITSPPYLCMTDYTLGQRLSYYWLEPSLFEDDFKLEIGARRRRSMKPELIISDYLDKMNSLPKLGRELLPPGGFFAMVLGEPLAKAFGDIEIFNLVDEMFNKNDFELIWSTLRQIHWHRNQGYQRLRKERICVYAVR